MGVRNMKLNIYQKLHKAACEAGGVAKGKKVPGMHFNPLQHDEVQKVAMEALLNNFFIRALALGSKYLMGIIILISLITALYMLNSKIVSFFLALNIMLIK